MPTITTPHQDVPPVTGDPVAIMYDPAVADIERLTDELRQARAKVRQAEEGYQEFIRAREALEGVFREQIDNFRAAEADEAAAEKTLKEYLCNTFNMFGHLFRGKLYRYIPGLSVRERTALKVTDHDAAMTWALRDINNHQFLTIDERKLAEEYTKDVGGRDLPGFVMIQKTLTGVVAETV